MSYHFSVRMSKIAIYKCKQFALLCCKAETWQIEICIIIHWKHWYFPYFNSVELVIYTEKAMAPHSSTLAWKILWAGEPGRLQSMGSRTVGHDWATSLSLFSFMHWRRKWQPTPVFLPGESQGRGAWWAAVYGVAQSQTRLKRLSSSSSSTPISLCLDFWRLIVSPEIRSW